ncbi:helix-turn-helix transcriptional regulator [Thermoactinospora rubra]|uniref:helix-turn-helix transcriptional regulator n=1 Tax=Thermoactinospora rubra TaxID=1088767 RepID=UPI000A0F78BE|nr:AAA family ATPase [Thermoactinospora rubra]
MPSLPEPTTLVGRDEALAAALGALTGAAAGPPAFVIVEGEAGIGKTRLVQECLAAPALRGRVVAGAACPPLREPFPLGPLVDGLRKVWEGAGPIALSRLGGALRPLFPEWADELPPPLDGLDDPRATRHRLFRALNELVERLKVDVLVIEDAHWADSATLEWLLNLSASTGHTTSVMVTYRPYDVASGSLLPRLTSRLPAGMTPVRVALEPLDVPQTRRLVASMFDVEEVSEQFAAFLHEHTGGVPLAVEESVRLLRDRRDIVRSGGEWTRRVLAELRVPPTVRDSVLERVGQLPPATRAVLNALAVLGAPADEPLVAAVAGLDATAVRDGLSGGLACGLLREAEPGAFAFRHVLAAKAVEGAILAPERRLLHGRAGAALGADKHPSPVRLSRHFREAGDVEAWARHAEATAELALQSGDDHTAVTVLLDLLTEAEHPLERRTRLASKLAEAATMGSEPPSTLEGRVRDALEQVLRDPALPAQDRGELRLALGRLKLALERWDDGFADVEAAVPDLGHRPALAARAMLYLATPLTEAWPATRHLAWARQATSLFDRIDDPVERLLSAFSHATALLMLGEAAGWHAADDIPTTAATESEAREIARGSLNIAHCALLWGRYAEARHWADRAGRLIDNTGFRRVSDPHRIGKAHLAWYTGEWEGLAESIADMVEAPPEESPHRLDARLLLGKLSLARGARQRAETLLTEVIEGARGRANPFVYAQAAMARIHLAAGAPEAALRLTEPVMAVIEGKGVWLWATDLAPVHVEALLGAGREEEARRLVRAFAAAAPAPAPSAALVTCRALVEPNSATAADLYGAAAAAWAALPRPYDEAQAIERGGGALLRHGDTAAGIGLLSEALRRFKDLGARWDADRVAHLMRENGVEVPLAWRGGRRGYGDRLSPREREVVDLVAQGWTNRKVAAALYLSPRTVDRHLSTAMRKLGVSSRTELARVVALTADSEQIFG